MRLVSQLGLPDHVVAAERHVERGCGMCGVASAKDTLIWMDDMGACASTVSKAISVCNASGCW
jgi:hypothetical protein